MSIKMPRMTTRRPRRYRRKPMALRRRKARAALHRQVHKFKRQVFLGTYKASSTSGGTQTAIAKAFSFQLVDIGNVSDYTSLFDQYKITGVSLRVIPKTSEQIQVATSGTTQTIGYGQVVTAIDYDDAVNPTTKDELLEYGSSKTTSSNRIHTRFIRPKMLNVVFRNAITSGYAPVKATWLDQAYNDLPHYGVKLWVDPPSAGGVADTSISYDVYATYYLSFKNTR